VDLAFLDVDYGVENLRYQPQFDLADEALNGFQCAVRVGHAEQADARQSDVAENLEIARSANLVKDYEIRPTRKITSAVFSKSPSSGAY
jgi:hypothetical protein